MYLHLPLQNFNLNTKTSGEKTQVFDPVRKRWVILTPEEHVRQLFLQFLLVELAYPKAKIAIEKTVDVFGIRKRFDMVVFNKNLAPWMVIECKAPEINLTEKTFHQLLEYQHNLQATYWVLTNGHHTLCADAGDLPQLNWLSLLPAYNSGILS